MELGLTFGSVGDLIAITVLIKDIVAAVDDARGSAKEYQDLARALDTLRLTLEEVQRTFEDPDIVHSLEDPAKIALDIVAQTNECLNGFLCQIGKYEPTLSAVASGKRNCLNSVGRKVQWKLNEREVEKFRVEVMGYTLTLNVLLKAITVRILQRNHDALVKEQTAAESRTAALIRQSEASLEKWISFIGRQIISRLQVIHRSGTELKSSVGQIITMMFTISSDVSIIRAIVMRLDRGPNDEHFILEDITGRRVPIHLSTITSWAVLNFILSERFKGKKGARRIQRRLYSLREINTQREVDESMPWENAFLPYQKITMSLMCREAGATTSCPFCKTPSDHDRGIEVECVKCKRFFTRVNKASSSQDQVWSRRSHRSQASNSSSDSEIDSDHEDLQGFVRVHIVPGIRRIGAVFWRCDNCHGENTFNIGKVCSNYPCQARYTQTCHVYAVSVRG